ncbi:protein TRC8 homolog [Tachypleus tridentatus]|uniref:protein TRC8 homolog n=1 Tax=Tachypleus tridentatus TaxID=6853 RepID=UPI003FD58CE9
MSLQSKVWSLLNVVLRVPPVFIMDALLNARLGLSPYKPEKDDYQAVVSNSTEDQDTIDVDGSVLTWFSLYSSGFCAAFFVFLLNTKQLLSVYLWLASTGVILWSYIGNEEYMKYAIGLGEKNSNVGYELLNINLQAFLKFGGNYLLQVFLAMVFCFSNNSFQNIPPKRIVGLSFIGPTIISLLPFPASVLQCTPLLSSAVAFLYIFISLLSHGRLIVETLISEFQWCNDVIKHYGLYMLLENQWLRLQVPQVLRVFWLTRVIEQAVLLLADTFHGTNATGSVFSMLFDNSYIITKELLIRGCETLVAVLGMTSVVSSISHYIGYSMQCFLHLEDPEDRSIGTVSAILFFILALQTGLTGMEPEKRFQRLYRNICLLFTAIMHFVHNMVNPLLLSLSASKNTSYNKHGRALTVCAFLIVFPCWFLAYLWSKHTISTWLLAVSAFSIEVVIKVVISLLVYLLFMIDAYRNTFWEKLDDYVYYIRATGNTIEFIFGIFLFFNGAWILLFESGGTIRAFMMCIHAYFNIWLQAKSGWKVFMKRQSAVKKINSLPEASEDQLRNFDDVCAICYQELNNARITRCNHYFHGVCLRKWLYLQDICPLCHKTLYNLEFEESHPENANENSVVENEILHEHQD